MEVADPPVVEYLLLEQPWPLVGGLVAAAVLMAAVAQRRRDRRWLGAAIGALVLAPGAYVLATMVNTDRERLVARSRALVGATVSPVDFEHVATFLDADVTLTGPHGAHWLDADAIDRTLRRAEQRWGIEAQSIADLKAATTGRRQGRTALSLRTTLGGRLDYGPIRSGWVLQWRQDADGTWRVQRIACMQINNREPRQEMLQR